MDFGWSEGESAVLKHIQDVCQEVVHPLARRIGEGDGDALKNAVQVLYDNKFMAIPFPSEIGGLALPFTVWAKAAEIVSYQSATVGMVFGASMLAAYPILLFGSDDLKHELLPALLTGERTGAFALTEPLAGSDAAAITTRALPVNDSYRLTGRKAFITNAGLADTYIVIAKTQPERGVRGMSSFVVDAGVPGFIVGGQQHKMAFPALSNAGLSFNDCSVPARRLLGHEGHGFRTAMETLDLGRIAVAAGAVGIARAALDIALSYAHTRQQFNEPIGNFELIQEKIARMAVAVDSAELLYLKAAWLKDQGRPFSEAAAMAKLYGSKVAKSVTDDAVEIFGGYGYGASVERYYREARLFELVEGTSEIQTLVIAKSVFRRSS